MTDLYIHCILACTTGEGIADSRERMVLAGGYGGWPPVDPHVDL